jgi:uncharacterized protein (TIGR02391 family)
MHAERPAIERILDALYPTWRDENPPDEYYRWRQHYNAAMYLLSRLQRQQELDERLGSAAPHMAADALHPWVWDAAQAQWKSGHYAEAVRAAAVNLNSRLQNKVGRRNLSDKKLVNEAFSDAPATEEHVRLRVVSKDDSETYKSLQEGVRSFGVGVFMAIRNPLSHLPVEELDISQQEALERLASISLLARWIEGAVVEGLPTAP